MKIDEIKDKIYFPHEQIRQGQEDLIVDIYRTINKGKVLLANAPTGLGKTASVLSVAIPYAIKNKKTIFFLTNRHTQHKIAVDTLKEINKKFDCGIVSVDLIGKKWMCNQEVANLFGSEFNEFCKAVVEKGECEYYNNVKKKKELTVLAKYSISELEKKGPIHNEELQVYSNRKNMCAYELSLALAKKANVIIGDYYYMFNPMVAGTILQKLGLELSDIILVVDEAHNLPSRISDMLSSNLTTNMIKNSIREAEKFGFNDLVFNLSELRTILEKLAVFEKSNNSFSAKEKLIERETFVNNILKIKDYDLLVEELELAAEEIRKKQKKSFLGGIANFLDSWTGNNEGYSRIISEQEGRSGTFISLQYSCLDPSLISTDIFRNVDSAILMSGTLQPTFMYKDLLGVSRAIEKTYPSPFPPENKLSLVVPVTSTKFTTRGDAMFNEIAKHCAELAQMIPGNAAFFFPSYKLRDKISYQLEPMIRTKETIWEKQSMSKEEKERVLADFKMKKFPGAILLAVTGANFAEGVDFPGDLLQGVVVVGLPLARPDLKTKQTINYYEKKFSRGWNYAYIYPAMNKCIQSAGRCIRSSTDRGAVIYLEERFAWQNYFNCLPKTGLIVSKQYEKFLSNFFSS